MTLENWQNVKKHDKRTNSDLKKTTLKIRDRAIQAPLKTEGELSCVTLVTNSVISHEWGKDM
jgi:hypothetical protein